MTVTSNPPPDTIRLEFDYTPEDVGEVQSVIKQRSRKTPGLNKWFYWILFIAMAAIFFLLLNHHRTTAAPPRATNASPTGFNRTSIRFGIPALLMIGYAVYSVNYLRRRQSPEEHFKSNPTLKLHQTLEINDTEISLSSPEACTIWKWIAVKSMAETDNLFLAEIELSRYLMIPKRAIAPEQIDFVRQFLAQHIKVFR